MSNLPSNRDLKVRIAEAEREKKDGVELLTTVGAAHVLRISTGTFLRHFREVKWYKLSKERINNGYVFKPSEVKEVYRDWYLGDD